MSSTNRGYDRHASDYYVTPIQPIYDFFNAFLAAESEAPEYIKIIQQPDKGVWLDPCAGGDEKHPMSYPTVIRDLFDPYSLNTLDIREDSLARDKGDYLKLKLAFKPNFIITNPPFYLAKEIIEKALDDVADGGYVIMLLRLNFLGSRGRYEFWQKHMPKYIFVHHQRMSFTENKATDSIEYAHFVWQKGFNPDCSELAII